MRFSIPCVPVLAAALSVGASTEPCIARQAADHRIKWTAPVVVKGGSLAGFEAPPNAGADKLLLYASPTLSGAGVDKQWPAKEGWKLVARELCRPGASDVTVTFVDGRSDKTKIGDVKIPLTKGLAEVVFAIRAVRDAKSQKTTATAEAWLVTTEWLEELGRFEVPESVMADCGSAEPPSLDPGVVSGAAGPVLDFVAAWSWNGESASALLGSARARDRGRGVDVQGVAPELAALANQPLSKWPRPVILVTFAAPNGAVPEKSCPVIPRHPLPEEEVVREWLSSNDAISMSVKITATHPGEIAATLLKGQLDVYGDGVVHYRLAGPVQQRDRDKDLGPLAEAGVPTVEYCRHDSAVVVRSREHGWVRLTVEECSADASQETPDDGVRSARPGLLAALGTEAPQAALQARLVNWTVRIADPRHLLPAKKDLDLTTLSGSADPDVDTHLRVPPQVVDGMSSPIPVSSGDLLLVWNEKSGVTTASFELCSRALAKRSSDPSSDSDVYITFARTRERPTETAPAEVLRALDAGAGGK
jgi:hypothetical protein